MARGQTAIPQNTLTTLIEGGSAYGGVRMTRAIIKNTSGGSKTVYLQWTAESSTLDATNGFPLDDGETLGIDLNREGAGSNQLMADIQAWCTSSGGGSLAWVAE